MIIIGELLTIVGLLFWTSKRYNLEESFAVWLSGFNAIANKFSFNWIKSVPRFCPDAGGSGIGSGSGALVTSKSRSKPKSK